jgi:hypothetical protein
LVMIWKSFSPFLRLPRGRNFFVVGGWLRKYGFLSIYRGGDAISTMRGCPFDPRVVGYLYNLARFIFFFYNPMQMRPTEYIKYGKSLS